MSAMNEAEVYQKLTKDGDSLAAIKKNTEMLRQHFTVESQRVAHNLSQLDPNNKERHSAEAERILHENNGVLDRVLMEIASKSPQKMPLPVEAINKASEATKIPRNQAKAVISFPVVLFAALPAAVFYTMISIIAVVAVLFVALVADDILLKIGLKEWLANYKDIDKKLVIKVWVSVCYIVAVIRGYMMIRRGGTIREMFNELFSKSLIEILPGGKN